MNVNEYVNQYVLWIVRIKISMSTTIIYVKHKILGHLERMLINGIISTLQIFVFMINGNISSLVSTFFVLSNITDIIIITYIINWAGSLRYFLNLCFYQTVSWKPIPSDRTVLQHNLYHS